MQNSSAKRLWVFPKRSHCFWFGSFCSDGLGVLSVRLTALGFLGFSRVAGFLCSLGVSFLEGSFTIKNV